jgi:uncharacterized membrane protein YpjA
MAISHGLLSIRTRLRLHCVIIVKVTVFPNQVIKYALQFKPTTSDLFKNVKLKPIYEEQVIYL